MNTTALAAEQKCDCHVLYKLEYLVKPVFPRPQSAVTRAINTHIHIVIKSINSSWLARKNTISSTTIEIIIRSTYLSTLDWKDFEHPAGIWLLPYRNCSLLCIINIVINKSGKTALGGNFPSLQRLIYYLSDTDMYVDCSSRQSKNVLISHSI